MSVFSVRFINCLIGAIFVWTDAICSCVGVCFFLSYFVKSSCIHSCLSNQADEFINLLIYLFAYFLSNFILLYRVECCFFFRFVFEYCKK